MDTVKFTIMGATVEIPKYKDCPMCSAKNACCHTSYGNYDTPCDMCKDSEEYKREQEKRALISKDLKSNTWKNMELAKPHAVFRYKNKDLVTDGKGNIISDADHRERPLGKPGEIKNI